MSKQLHILLVFPVAADVLPVLSFLNTITKIILVKNQYDTLNSMYLLFHLSTCFEHLVLIIRRVKLY